MTATSEKTMTGTPSSAIKRFGWMLVAGLVPALLAGCAAELKRAPNVILMTLDTLRADHLGCYGYERPTSPWLDSFAKVATFYPRSHSTSSWTLPAHASLFTGKYPFEHGAHSFKVSDDETALSVLAEHHVTLAEVLQAEGYQTVAITGNASFLAERFKLNQGFDSYVNEQVNGWELSERALEWLEERGPDPFFLFLNFVDTHNPYQTGSGREEHDQGFLSKQDDRQSFYIYRELRPHILGRKRPFPHEKVTLLINQYDTAIRTLDEVLKSLITSLKEMELYDDTLIVITSDHGEFLGERDLIDHGREVYEGGLWVPLIIKFPGQNKGKVDESLVTSADIPHLILERFPRAIRKRTLPNFPNAPGRQPAIGENYYVHPAEFNDHEYNRKRFNQVRTAIYDWPYKYIHDSGGNHELYDLAEDPSESNNLYEQKRNVAQKLEARWRNLRSEREVVVDPRAVRAPNQQEIEGLKALGYLE
jgi:arylsulfatase A-like enzyme